MPTQTVFVALVNKCFLLPAAMPTVQKLKQLYDDHPNSMVLVVGHTDASGTASYNDLLSLERAESVVAFMKDDVDAWLSWYAPSKSWEKRWGRLEDQLMIASLSDFPDEVAPTDAIPWYRSQRGLPGSPHQLNDGERASLVAEYMAHDDTTLPPGIAIAAHGCGESFPLTEEDLGGVASAGSKQRDRRVEIYLFDRDLGVQPDPGGTISPPGSTAYPEWCRRAQTTHDFDLVRRRAIVVGFHVGIDEPEREGDMVIVDEGGDEVLRIPLTEADDDRDGMCFFRLDPKILPKRIAGYWDKGYELWPVLAACDVEDLAAALAVGDTERGAAMAFGGKTS